MNLPMFQLNRPSSSAVAATKGPDKKTAQAKRLRAMNAARAAADKAKKA